MKKTFYTILIIVLTITISIKVADALGTLEPQGTVGDDTQYTLNDIYEKLVTGFGPGFEGSGTMNVPDPVEASFNTLSEIYEAIPPTLSILSTTTTVPVGINRTVTTLAAIDSDLIPGNIKQGVTLFGVAGSLSGAGGTLTWSTDQGAKTFNNAFFTCLGTVDGSTGWRLPSAKELMQSSVLVDLTTYWGDIYDDTNNNAVTVTTDMLPYLSLTSVFVGTPHTLCVK